MIDGLANLTAKRMYDVEILHALHRGDESTAQEILHQTLNSPEYLFDEYVKDNRLDDVIAFAPQCSEAAIGRGLHAAIIRVPVNPHMLCAILPYTELSTRNYALQLACAQDCSIAVDILYPLCDIPRVVDMLNHPLWRADAWRNTLQQRMDAEKLRETLTAQLPSLSETPQRKI